MIILEGVFNKIDVDITEYHDKGLSKEEIIEKISDEYNINKNDVESYYEEKYEN